MNSIQRRVGERKSVLLSCHVLHAVQYLTPHIIFLTHVRLVTHCHVRQIRDLIDKYPHHIVLACDDYRRLAARILAWDDVEGVRVMAKERKLMVETRCPEAVYARLRAVSLEDGTAMNEVVSDADSI